MTTRLFQLPQPKQARVIRGLSWEQVEEFDSALEDFAGIKLAYLDETLEIMPISPEHEDFKSTLVLLLEAFLRESRIRFYKRGSATLGTRSLKARNEPDESYNLEKPKAYPDLVIEVVVSSDGVDKLEGYRRMGIPEVWFWEDGVLTIHQLIEGKYQRGRTSELLPSLPIDLLSRYVTYYDQWEAVNEFTELIRGGQSL